MDIEANSKTLALPPVTTVSMAVAGYPTVAAALPPFMAATPPATGSMLPQLTVGNNASAQRPTVVTPKAANGWSATAATPPLTELPPPAQPLAMSTFTPSLQNFVTARLPPPPATALREATLKPIPFTLTSSAPSGASASLGFYPSLHSHSSTLSSAQSTGTLSSSWESVPPALLYPITVPSAQPVANGARQRPPPYVPTSVISNSSTVSDVAPCATANASTFQVSRL